MLHKTLLAAIIALSLAAGGIFLPFLLRTDTLAGPGLHETLDGAGRQAGEPGRPIIIRWSTESEVDTAGYNIYRALDEAGPWQQINPRLIPGSSDPLRGGSYVFTDTQVLAGQTYWYELEEVELGGRQARLERIEATAEAQRANPLAGLPCGSIFLALAGLGMVTVRTGRQL